MARTRSQDYESIKITILDRAAELFARKGFADTSIVEISEASGLSKSGIYHYFKSKNDVLNTLVSEHVEKVFDVVGAALQTSLDPVKQFEALTAMLLETYSHSKHRHAVMMNDLDSLKERERERVVDLERRVVKFTEGVIERVNPGLLADPAFRRPAVMLFFGMINWTYTWFDANRGMNPRQLAAMASGIFLNGLLATRLEDINDDN
ncbi:Transcriptional regulator TetR family [Paramagnetospirillum magnetotacticum MS-1]|uniref:Transcriptional regulator TetR family n=1 Tax=Paramagnetospirillum magnetotacticum MS-1 TaxID=272627 RepID=A0A0C2YZM5_PARME|nr:TetR/AcrR family transcriptional regulator [Paramagnetospirillum magnetotacticum]KIM00539.1 Transcriptional regulator TetR family [Paramagnetospirillum magnetotacticum MS-1]